MKIEGLLPIGTIVRIGAVPDRQLQIVGQGQRKPDSQEVCDYCAVPYPEGYIDGDHMILLNNEDIIQIDDYGYIDDESIEYTGHIENIVRMLRDGSLAFDDLSEN